MAYIEIKDLKKSFTNKKSETYIHHLQRHIKINRGGLTPPLSFYIYNPDNPVPDFLIPIHLP